MSYQTQEMPGEDQARGQRDDHYRNVIALTWAIGPAVESNRCYQRQEASAEGNARLDNTHSPHRRSSRRAGLYDSPVENDGFEFLVPRTR